MKKNLNTSLLKVAFVMLFFNFNVINSQNYCNSNPVDVHGDLSVSGNRIVDKNNNPVSFAGNSMFWSNTTWGAEKYYNENVVSWLKEDWGTTIIRAAMGVEDFGGYLTDPTANKKRITTVVDAAIDEGLYVIIDWHSHNAENYQSQAIDFFKEMANKYKNYPNVIYEVYNEPIHVSWSNDVKPYAEAVISEIRAIDPDNLIIVGSPTWSQDVDIASNAPITLSTNIAYTLHFYAGTHGASLRAKAQRALDNGIALMATEWGTVSASGDGSVNNSSTDQWMDFLEKNYISHLNWSVNDKSEGASILKPGSSANGNWSDSNLTTSGLKVKNIIESWNQYCNGEFVEPEVTQITTPPAVVTVPKVEAVKTNSNEVFEIPSRIQAENYNEESGTETEASSDNGDGENVGYIDIGDYVVYNVNVPSNGNYTIDFRVASLTNGANFDIYSGGSVVGRVSSNATGGWQTWETVSETVHLNQGNQAIRLVATGFGWNINWLDISEEEVISTPEIVEVIVPIEVEPEVISTPEIVEEVIAPIEVEPEVISNPEIVEVIVPTEVEEEVVTTNSREVFTIPSKIEAEDYASQSGTQTEASSDYRGGRNIGYIDEGDFLTYNINVPSNGSYTIDFRIASPLIRGVNFDIYSNNSNIGTVSSDPTGGWQTWETISEIVYLNQGEQTIKLVANDRGWNINWMEFSKVNNSNEEVVIETEETETSCNDIPEWSPNVVYNEAGTQVVYEGNIYENKWYTLNQNPITFSVNTWDLWTLLGSCTGASNKELILGTDLLDISTYPNPFVEYLNVIVKATNLSQMVNRVNIVDITGRIIISELVNTNEFTLNNISKLEDGIYMLQVFNSKEQLIKVKKIIKK